MGHLLRLLHLLTGSLPGLHRRAGLLGGSLPGLPSHQPLLGPQQLLGGLLVDNLAAHPLVGFGSLAVALLGGLRV